MRGGGRGGGGGPAHAATEKAEAAAIPATSRKLVQGLKGILADRSEFEIYAMLWDCGMDPDVAVERLLSQDSFHEVRRKRDKKKEIKDTQESRPRASNKPMYQRYRAGFDQGSRFQYGFGDSTRGVKGSSKKESGSNAPSNLSILGSGKTSNPTEMKLVTSDSAIDEAPMVPSAQADVKPSTFMAPSQVQQGWIGMPGRRTMADIVKMGRPQGKLVSTPVGSHASSPAAGGSIISNPPNHVSMESRNTDLPSELDHRMINELPNGTAEDDPPVNELPPGEGSEVTKSFGTQSMNANPQGSLTPYVGTDGIEDDTYLGETQEVSVSISAECLTSTEPVSVFDKEIQSENSHLNNGLIEKADDYQSGGLSIEHHSNSNGDVSSTMTNFEQLDLHEEKRPKSSGDNPAVIIPDHLQVSNVDCAHLTFGSFVSGTLAASLSMKPLNSNVEVATDSDNNFSVDQSDVRTHEHENKETVTAAPDDYAVSATNTKMENLDIPSAQQSEVRRADLMDAPNSVEYNLPSASHYVSSSTVQPDSVAQTYPQENRQLQNISPLSTLMQANIPSGLLPPAIPPLPDLDPAFSLLLTNPPLATLIHGSTSSSISSATVSMQENVNPGGFSNSQSAQSQPSASITPGPPLTQHLALHPYAQATLPLGPYAGMIGYPSLPQSYAYIPPAAFQQPYMNSGLFHQTAPAIPNSSVKYPLPHYKSNVALASLPQPASLLPNYVGGVGTANSIPGNFALNQSAGSAPTTLGFDGAVPSQYKDGNHFISLQQSENPAMWMHGVGSRAMPPLAANTLYGYQGQSHQSGFRQGQLPSQFGTALGQSQPGLGPEHRNPSDSNLSAVAQANQMWPNNY